MEALRWDRLESLFAAAADLPAGARTEYLDDACSGDPALRLQVESLLSASEEASGFIGRAIADTARDATGAARPGQRLGAYEIVRELGRGGMGAVFLGRRADREYEAEVAIKLIRGVHTAEHLRRFRAERQILADLRHPNIAQLLDGGTTGDAVPYVVMEHVDGTPLDVHCDRKRLTVEQRLALFDAVCSAVRFAHQNLVVHCDLKPRNVLVTPAGIPKLLDFGIARLLEPGTPAAEAASALRMATPAYASPEQVAGAPITVATDVYGLGVVLYELLTGRLPHPLRGTSARERERLLLETDPLPPSEAVRLPGDDGAHPGRGAAARGTTPERLARRLRGDLDAILLRALRRDPAHRYESVEALSEDLRRHRATLPVRARPDGWRYRTGRFVRRRRGGVAAAAAAALMVGGFSAATKVQADRVARERDAATLARAEAEQVSSFLVDLFEVADPGETSGETVTAREILDRGAARVGLELRDQPGTLAAMLDVMGRVYRNLGLFDRAAPLVDSALALRRAVYGPEHPAVAASLQSAAVIRSDLGAYDSARVLYRAALEQRRRLLPPGDPAIGESLAELAGLESDAGEYEAAEPLYREALAIDRAAHGGEHATVAADLVNFGALLRRSGDYRAAEPMLREGLAMRRRLFGDDHIEVGHALNQLGRLLVLQGRPRDAEPVIREGLAVRRRIYGDRHMEVAASLGNLAGVLNDVGDTGGAITARRESLEIIRGLLGDEHPYTAATLQSLAYAHHEAGALDSARVDYQRAIAIQRRVLAPEDPNLGFALTGLGRVLVDLDRPAEAERLLREGLAVRRAGLPEGHWFIAASESALGECLMRLGRPGEAEPLLTAALATLEETFGPDDSRAVRVRERLAALHATPGAG